MSYDWTFAAAAGHEDGVKYDCQFMDAFTGLLWNGVAMVAAPTHASTVTQATEINGAGIFGIAAPAGLPGGKQYKIWARKRAGTDSAATDNIITSGHIQKLASGRVILVS